MATISSTNPTELIDAEPATAGFRARWLEPLWSKLASSGFLSFLISTMVHLALLLILAIFTIHFPGAGNVFSILAGRSENDQLVDETFEVVKDPTETDPLEEPLDPTVTDSMVRATDSLEHLPETLLDPTAEQIAKTDPPTAIEQTVQASTGLLAANAFRSTRLDSRRGASRKQAVQDRGGTEQSEQAVEDALAWLAAHQFADGGWSLHSDHPDCMGKCQYGVSGLDGHRIAATGLALLCFLGAGHTENEGPYQSHVRKGIYFLIQHMEITEHGGRFTEPSNHSHMYEHGIAALALCEAYQLSLDPAFKSECQETINYIAYAQHTDGGWGYNPRSPGDLSIACWQMMSVKSGVAGKLQIPFDSIKRFDRFLDSQQSQGGSMYGYRSNAPKPSTTAIGLLMRMYRGWPQSDPRLIKGANYLFEVGPSPYDVYHNFYATQVLFHLEGPLWEAWNAKMRDYLVSTQSQKGHEKGSWFFPGGLNPQGGRLYTTALSCMTLEVYYRHMPIYGPIPFDDFEL